MSIGTIMLKCFSIFLNRIDINMHIRNKHELSNKQVASHLLQNADTICAGSWIDVEINLLSDQAFNQGPLHDPVLFVF